MRPTCCPNDVKEHVRLEHQSEALNTMMGHKPFHVPASLAPQKIVDIGCGTGSMTVLLAEKHPSAIVYGVDLSPVPPVHKKPANVEYVIQDITTLVGADERFQKATFDYTFNRMLVAGMTDWPGYVSTVYSLLRPGGWAEMHEIEFRW